MISALVTSITSLKSPVATSFIARVMSLSASTSPSSNRRIKAIFVEVEAFVVCKERWRAVAELMIACGDKACGADVVNA